MGGKRSENIARMQFQPGDEIPNLLIRLGKHFPPDFGKMTMERLNMFFIIASFILFSFSKDACATDEIKVWKEFIQVVEKGEFSADMIRPHFESLRKSNMDFVNMMREKASWDDAYNYMTKAMIAIARRYSGEEVTKRLLDEGYPEEMLRPMDGAG
ncbi:MAG: hypothetical protein ACE5I1_20410, partial [bacterium]